MVPQTINGRMLHALMMRDFHTHDAERKAMNLDSYSRKTVYRAVSLVFRNLAVLRFGAEPDPRASVDKFMRTALRVDDYPLPFDDAKVLVLSALDDVERDSGLPGAQLIVHKSRMIVALASDLRLQPQDADGLVVAVEKIIATEFP